MGPLVLAVFPFSEGAGEGGEERLRGDLHRAAVLGHEGRVERGDVPVERGGAGQAQARDGVALPVDALLGASQPVVVTEAAWRRGLLGH